MSITKFDLSKVAPFKITSGNQNTNPIKCEFPYLGDVFHGLRVQTDENNVASVKCDFESDIQNKLVFFGLRDLRGTNDTLTFSIICGDYTIKGVFGNKMFHIEKLKGEDVLETIETGIRRCTHTTQIEIENFGDNGISLYADKRFLASFEDIKLYNSIEFKIEDIAPTYLFIDKLTIADPNPIVSMSLPFDTKEIGYFDSFEISPAILEYKAQDESYPTTDRFSYSSTNSNCVEAMSTGNIRGGKELGEATVTVKADSGVCCNVNVVYNDYKVKSLSLSDSSYIQEQNTVSEKTIFLGEEAILNCIINPINATNKNVVWTSSNNDILTVKNGRVKALKEGNATITATIDGVSACCKFTVNKKMINSDVTLYVSPNGDDKNSGSIENPLATINNALLLCESIESGKSVAIMLRKGEYSIDKGATLYGEKLNHLKSLTISNFNNEEVTLLGCKIIDSRDMRKVNESDKLSQIRQEVKDKLYVIDLSKYGLTEPKTLPYTGHSMTMLPWIKENNPNWNDSYYSLFFNSKEMTLARFPNAGEGTTGIGFAHVDQIVHNGAVPRNWWPDMQCCDNWTVLEDRDVNDKFRVKSNEALDRIPYWKNENNPWVVGYWHNEFSDQSMPIDTIYDDGSFSGSEPSCYGISKIAKFFAYNMLCEIDVPGEWYIDQSDFKLYFYPPVDCDMNEHNILEIPTLGDNFFTLIDCNNVTIENITMKANLRSGVEINAGNNCIVSHCVISGTRGRSVNILEYVKNNHTLTPTSCGVQYCTLKDVNGGVGLYGGDRLTLTKGLNFVKFCTITNFSTVTTSYNPAVEMFGVGNIISGCDISDAPHNAIIFRGNDHLIEFNELHHVVKDAGDQSAIYSGRDVCGRGTVIKNNYFHHIGNPINVVENSAIYFDDLSSQSYIIDNVIEDVHWGIFLNGGRDFVVIGNEFARVDAGVTLTDWAYVGVSNWHTHGYGLYRHPLTYLPADDTDWQVEGGVYSKYANLRNMLNDRQLDSKYNSVINNTMHAVEGYENKPVLYCNRGVGFNEEIVTKIWCYNKNNIVKNEE